MDCIFCKIIAKEIPSDIVYEDESVLAFRDLHPLAPVHILIIPKVHVESMNDLKDEALMGHMLGTAVKIAKDLKISDGGYKLLIRTGRDGGQEVPHVHLHLLGGAKLKEEISAEE